jgi:hypothetical protein
MKITKRNLRRLINESWAIDNFDPRSFEKKVQGVEIAVDVLRNSLAFRSPAVREAMRTMQDSIEAVRIAVAGEIQAHDATGDAAMRSNRRDVDAYMQDAMNTDETYQDYDYSPADPRGRDEW